MNKIFYAITALLGTIPGFAVFKANLGVPPGRTQVFAGFVEACGVIVLLVLWVYRKRLKRVARYKLVRWAVGSFAAFVVFLIAILYMQDTCLVVATKPHYAEYGAVYFPLWLRGDLLARVNREGSRVAVVDKYGPQAIDEQIGKESSNTRSFTTILFLLAFCGVFSLLAMAFGLLGFRLEPPAADGSGT